MIFGEHEIGGLTFRPATERGYCQNHLIEAVRRDTDEAGFPSVTINRFDRADLERLRDLCDEAPS